MRHSMDPLDTCTILAGTRVADEEVVMADGLSQMGTIGGRGKEQK